MRRAAAAYAAYSYAKYWSSGVAFSSSTDDGATWSTPTNALPEQESSNDEGYGDVRLAAAPDRSGIYVAAFWTHWHGRNIDFSSSDNQGSGWTPGKTIAGAIPMAPNYRALLWRRAAAGTYWSPMPGGG